MRDPVCGMEIEPRAAAGSSIYSGATFYFCSPDCKKKFEAAPEDYASAKGNSDAAACCHHEEVLTGKIPANPNAEYFCPMCAGMESDQPGTCPKCGMALERSTPRAAQSKTIYTCPMHTEIEEYRPGSCPICGIALEPKNILAHAPEDDGELADMSLRFWFGATLALPVFLLGMAHIFPAAPH